MSTTILRQWLVLSMLPKAPRRIDAASIESRLRERGIEVHRRTIQRDLLDLAHVFPIVSDERAKPYGWQWSDEAKFVQVASPTEEVVSDWMEVLLRIRKPAMSLVLERLGARNRRDCDDDNDQSNDGFTTLTVAIEDSRATRQLILGHGDDVEVIAPPHLRKEIADRARRALAKHARKDDPP